MEPKTPLPPISEKITWQYLKEKTKGLIDNLEKELITQNVIFDECNNQLKKELEKDSKK